jgi:pyruvate,water dikinase
MVRSDLGAAGVMFTLDTESGFRDVVFITASYGLGETVVQGAVNPDEFYVTSRCSPRQAPDDPPRARQQDDQDGVKREAGQRRKRAHGRRCPVDRARFSLTDAEVSNWPATR